MNVGKDTRRGRRNALGIIGRGDGSPRVRFGATMPLVWCLNAAPAQLEQAGQAASYWREATDRGNSGPLSPRPQ